MKNFLVLVLCFFLFACQNDSKVIKREGEPDISRIEGDDSVMNKAIEQANYTLTQFDKALSSNDTTLVALALKMRFGTPEGGGEHIWMTDITRKDNQYYGVVGNLPSSTMEVKMGDRVMIPKDKISDWMYIKNGKLIGGYTIRAIRDQLSEAEQKAFDDENGFEVD